MATEMARSLCTILSFIPLSLYKGREIILLDTLTPMGSATPSLNKAL